MRFSQGRANHPRHEVVRSRPARRRFLAIEVLEDRAVPTALTLTLTAASDPTHPITVTDGSPLDMDTRPGAILFTGLIGNLSVNVQGALSKPNTLSPAEIDIKPSVTTASQLDLCSFGTASVVA